MSESEKFPWRKDSRLIEEAQYLFEERRLYENWVIFRFGCELSNIDDVDLIFRGQRYPDAILVRVRNGEIKEALNVEFEERSSDFKIHKHDPEKCDLIVCAEDGWEERWPSQKCPLPVNIVRHT